MTIPSRRQGLLPFPLEKRLSLTILEEQGERVDAEFGPSCVILRFIRLVWYVSIFDRIID